MFFAPACTIEQEVKPVQKSLRRPPHRASPAHSARRAKGMPAIYALALDILCACALLAAFALVHHALPRRMAAGNADSAAAIAVGKTLRPAARFSLPDTFAAGATVQTQTRYESADIQVELATARRGGAVCHVQDIHIGSVENLKTAFAEGSYGKGIRAHPLDMAIENNAVCAINGDYYGVSSESGAVIRNGVLYRNNPGNDALTLYYDGTMRIVDGRSFDGEAEMRKGAYQAWCFGPSLLDADGKALTEFQTDKRIGRSNPRTAIGYYAPGHYCFIAVDGRSETSGGMTLSELSQFCESLGLTLAYNLDGGQTSVMTFGGEIVNAPCDGGRKSSDIIYIGEIGGNA